MATRRKVPLRLVCGDDICTITSQLPLTPARIVVMGGERVTCCDEALVAEQKGEVVGAVTIAAEGEQHSGIPTIVGLFVDPRVRRQGIGRNLLVAAIQRCLQRGFSKIRVDVGSAYAKRIIDSLPAEFSVALDVHEMPEAFFLVD